MIISLPLKGFAFSTSVQADTERTQISFKEKGRKLLRTCLLSSSQYLMMNEPLEEASGKKRLPATVSSNINHMMQCV